MIRTHFQCLVTTHQDSDLSCRAMLQQLDVTCSTFFPLLCIFLEAKELGSHFQQDVFLLLTGLDLHGVQMNYGFEIVRRNKLFLLHSSRAFAQSII